MKNQIKSRFTPFKVNDKVWLEARNLKRNILDPKFTPKREGPFTITKVLSPLSYELKLPTSWKIHPVFHASLLTPYHKNEIHGPNFPAPPPDLIDNEEEYEIEWILKHRGPPKNRSYLIRWKGYTAEEDAWLKEAELGNAMQFLYTYKKRIKISSKQKNLRPPTGNNHPVRAKEGGCMITARTAHHIHGNLTLAADYYNKIFTRISGPPRWLSQRLQLTFIPVPLTTNTTSNTTPSGKYPNHLHLVNVPAPTLTSLEENPSAPVPAVTIAAPLTRPSTITTPNKNCHVHPIQL